MTGHQSIFKVFDGTIVNVKEAKTMMLKEIPRKQ